MRGGTECAKRVKATFKKNRELAGPRPETAPTDPLKQLVTALLGWEASESATAKAYGKLTEEMADLNEVRVSSVREIAAVIREYIPNSNECARNISRALARIYERESGVSLDSLHDRGRREARQYLESLEGVTPYAAAAVQLWSLGGHAIPVSWRLLEAMRREGLVDPEADVSVVQAFLERNVSAAEAKDFCHVMAKFAALKGPRPLTARAGGRGKKKSAKG